MRLEEGVKQEKQAGEREKNNKKEKNKKRTILKLPLCVVKRTDLTCS